MKFNSKHNNQYFNRSLENARNLMRLDGCLPHYIRVNKMYSSGICLRNTMFGRKRLRPNVYLHA
jgi:hypothetical protein